MLSLVYVLYFVGNTRVVKQKELEFFREELQSRLSSNYNVILKERKLPMSLLNDHQKVCAQLSFTISFEILHSMVMHNVSTSF